MNTNKYISCIKIKGQPILPPLLTAQKREECLEDKLKAIKLEKKRERDKVLEAYMNELEKIQTRTKDLIKFKDKPLYPTTLENQLSFNENEHVPSESIKNSQTKSTDIPEYFSSDTELRKESDKKCDNSSGPQYKLIRSNSYTLDSPSPILLAHLKKCSENNQSSSVSFDENTSKKDKTPHQINENDILTQETTITHSVKVVDVIKTGNGKSDTMPTFTESTDHVQDIIKLFEKQENEMNQFLTRQESSQIDDKSISMSPSQSIPYSISSSIDSINHSKNPSVISKNSRLRDTQTKQDWAASIIGAAVRGYLTRRLIHTEKVQSLIDTLKNALLCALELHNADIIDESDIELHRRLLQQVSSACFAFHDIFFTLSTKEQMAVIAMDRRRLKEKAKRALRSTSTSSLTKEKISSR